jgi:NADPH2:quinone reductase
VKALAFERFGGPDVLALRELPDPTARAGEAVVRTEAVGLNFADVYRRQGRYHLAGDPPWILGYEAAGEVVAVDPAHAASVPVGSRVAFADSPRANAELVAVPVGKLIGLPEGIDARDAVAVLLQGLTAQFLTADSFAVGPAHDVVVHAAGGGVGQLLVQIARLRGGRVLGIASTDEKRRAAAEAGADRVVDSAGAWWEEAIAWSRSGAGADVVYDSVGATLPRSFDAVAVGGTVVFFGMAGGDPDPVDPRMLMDTSKTLTGGDLWNVLRTPEDRARRAAELFGWLTAGDVRPRVAATFPLAEGAEAHRFLESRSSAGKVLLIP